MANKPRGYIEGVLRLVDLVGPRHPCAIELATIAVRALLGKIPRGMGDAREVLKLARVELSPYAGDTPEEELAGVQETLAVMRPQYPSIGRAGSLLADIYLRLPPELQPETPEKPPEPGLESTIDAGVPSDTLESPGEPASQ